MEESKNILNSLLVLLKYSVLFFSALDAADKKEILKYEPGSNGNGITPPDTPKRSQSPRAAGFLPKVPSRSSSPVAIPSKYSAAAHYLFYLFFPANNLIIY